MEENVRIWLLVTFYCVSSLSLGRGFVVREAGEENIPECSFDQKFIGNSTKTEIETCGWNIDVVGLNVWPWQPSKADQAAWLGGPSRY